MTCIHLKALEEEIISTGIKETYRGSPWTNNCREWVYFDIVFDTDAIASRLDFDPCVRVHENLDERSGTERGFECSECHDAVMGLLKGDRVYG